MALILSTSKIFFIAILWRFTASSWIWLWIKQVITERECCFFAQSYKVRGDMCIFSDVCLCKKERYSRAHVEMERIGVLWNEVVWCVWYINKNDAFLCMVGRALQGACRLQKKRWKLSKNGDGNQVFGKDHLGVKHNLFLRKISDCIEKKKEWIQYMMWEVRNGTWSNKT